MTAEPWLPRTAEELCDRDGRPVPTCPVCGRLMRRSLSVSGERPLACDVHGVRLPVFWVYQDGEDAA